MRMVAREKRQCDLFSVGVQPGLYSPENAMYFAQFPAAIFRPTMHSQKLSGSDL